MGMTITITDIGALGPDEAEFLRYVLETHEARQERKRAGLTAAEIAGLTTPFNAAEYVSGLPEFVASAQGDEVVFAMTEVEAEAMVTSCCGVLAKNDYDAGTTFDPKAGGFVKPLAEALSEVSSSASTAFAFTSPPAPGAKLDKRGLPWDARIHAGTKSINADGTWRNLKGVDKGLLAAVEAELTALMAMPATAPAPTAPAPTAPAPVTDFQGLTAWLTPQMLSGKVTQTQLQGVIGAMGVAGLMAFNARPDLIPDFVARVGAL